MMAEVVRAWNRVQQWEYRARYESCSHVVLLISDSLAMVTLSSLSSGLMVPLRCAVEVEG